MITEKGKARLLGILACFSLTGAAALLVYAPLCDTFANMRQTTRIGAYEESMDNCEEEELENMRRETKLYNQDIAAAQKRKSFSYQGEEATDARYDSLLNPGGDGVMAKLMIPSLHINLPVTHGTRSEDLEYCCGHMYGSSLPLGGEGTHAIIAGHTGLVTAELFTHLDKLKEGAQFYLTLLNETHVYEVAEIQVVLPEEESYYLGIRDGEDLVTLYTCTPYGINDHRLLVTGKRRLPDLVSGSGGGEEIQTSYLKVVLVGKAAGLAALPLLIPLFFLIRGRKERARERAEQRRNETAKQWSSDISRQQMDETTRPQTSEIAKQQTGKIAKQRMIETARQQAGENAREVGL